MTDRRARIATLALGVLVLCACGSELPSPPLSPSAALDGSPSVVPGAFCQKVPVQVVLHFDANHLWGTDLKSNTTVPVVPPPDARWVIDPGPPERLVDSAGRHVGYDGDIFYQACVDPITNTHVIDPEDLPNVSPGV